MSPLSLTPPSLCALLHDSLIATPRQHDDDDDDIWSPLAVHDSSLTITEDDLKQLFHLNLDSPDDSVKRMPFAFSPCRTEQETRDLAMFIESLLSPLVSSAVAFEQQQNNKDGDDDDEDKIMIDNSSHSLYSPLVWTDHSVNYLQPVPTPINAHDSHHHHHHHHHHSIPLSSDSDKENSKSDSASMPKKNANSKRRTNKHKKKKNHNLLWAPPSNLSFQQHRDRLELLRDYNNVQAQQIIQQDGGFDEVLGELPIVGAMEPVQLLPNILIDHHYDHHQNQWQTKPRKKKSSSYARTAMKERKQKSNKGRVDKKPNAGDIMMM